jgi:putative ABC transport system ATP-binding protein
MKSAAEIVISFEDVRKTYRIGNSEVHALDGVSLEVARGDFFAVMGPSGSGKSTMLNVIGCLDRPSGGRYLLRGRDVATRSDDELSDIRLAHLGFVFQSYNLIPQLSVLENIELPLYYLGTPAQQSRSKARELADLVGLSDRLAHRPQELSGGQRQRVAIARALANEPAVILADEPTGNLDSRTGEQILELLRALNESGITIIMVTHEAEVAATARHCIHMRDGRIERIASAAEQN